jgi:hypothetical protein
MSEDEHSGNGNGNGGGDGGGAATAASADPAIRASVPVARRDPRLGEELPIFCERCGYSLNGLTQIRCERCDVLHFACPECNHHQPINTLRPAVQRALGRLRALGLAWIVFVKINYFFWPLFAWGALGTGIAYNWRYNSVTGGYGVQASFENEVGIGIFLFAMAYAMIGRMLLLRWSRGLPIGVILGGLIALAMETGALIRYVEDTRGLPRPEGEGFILYMMCGLLGGIAGASCAWGVWMALVVSFLPKRAATALLEYQRALSRPKDAADFTDRTVSVTA